MFDRITTESLKSHLLGMGMDLIGFGPAERWENAPYLMSPQAILPNCKTVVVCAISITDTWTELGGEPDPQGDSPGGWMDQNSLLDRVGYRGVRILEEAGYKAIAVASSNIWRYRKFEDLPSLFAPDLSHMHAAVGAGLGEMVWTGLAVTPEFGPRMRYISIVTDAALLPTPMYDGPALCDKCMDCVRNCPSQAMKKDMNGKPHRFEIGGNVYEYANKNIWRCAWAEHFSLDLSSDTLEQDHVTENTITSEIAAHGTRGHERGVCQKVCVPPHLRSEQGSFGRREQQIAVNRINRRYPDTMPTLRKMRDDIMAKMRDWGADVAGCQPLPAESELAKQIAKEVPGMKSILAFCVRLPKGAKEALRKDSTVRDAYDYAVRFGTHHILLKTARMVEEYGYAAASYGANMWHIALPKAGEELAAMVGLGTMTTEGFVSTEFGEDAFAAAVVTNAEVEPLSCQPGRPWRPRPARAPSRLRRRLESLADDNRVSLFGIADTAHFSAVVDDLSLAIREESLGLHVADASGSMHGDWVPEIHDENIRLRTPEAHLPGAKAVICLGMHFPKALIANSGKEKTKQIGTYAYWNYQTIFELRFAAFALVRELTDMGHQATITENLLGIGSKVDTPRGSLPDARCNAIEAMLAGLGHVGRNGALITPEYGPHQRIICVVTNAPLPVDTPQTNQDGCDNCNACASSCPMQAITTRDIPVRINGAIVSIPNIQRNRCDWSKRYSLHPADGPALIGNNTQVEIPHDGELTIGDLAVGCQAKDPVMKHRTCILEQCMIQCPAGSA